MLTVESCRRLLGEAGANLSDSQLARLRDELYDVARCVVSLHDRHRDEDAPITDRGPDASNTTAAGRRRGHS
jgi:hypothetical protein